MTKFRVHYSDGAHHAGVGTFTSRVDAELFIQNIARGGYLAHLELPKARMVRSTSRGWFKVGSARPAWPHDPPLPK